jgi:hypothetical protein
VSPPYDRDFDPDEEPPDPARPVGFGYADRVIVGRDVCALPTPTPLAAGRLFTPGVGVLYAVYKSGKTFVSTGLSCSVATGTPWLGASVTQGSVLYVAAEGASGLGSRIDAWCEHHRQDDLSRLVFLPEPVNLGNVAAVRELAALADDLSISMIVVDTLARCTLGLDENSAKDASYVIAGLDMLRADSRFVLAVHHLGKDASRGARGSTALMAGADVAVELKADGPRLTLTCAFQKDAEPFAPIAARLLPVGRSVVAVSAVHETSGAEQVALDALRDADDGSGLTTTQWKTVSGIPESSFFRVRKQLVTDNRVTKNGSRYRLAIDSHSHGTLIRSHESTESVPESLSPALPIGRE